MLTAKKARTCPMILTPELQCDRPSYRFGPTSTAPTHGKQTRGFLPTPLPPTTKTLTREAHKMTTPNPAADALGITELKSQVATLTDLVRQSPSQTCARWTTPPHELPQNFAYQNEL